MLRHASFRFVLATATLMNGVIGFAPISLLGTRVGQMSATSVKDTSSRLQMLDMSSLTETTTTASQWFSDVGSNQLMAFADQGQNLAGIFFQASLLPYLLFLYFLSFRANRVPDIGNFGFQFVLIFVLATIPSGIISKATYGCSLADVDWLHGGAEALLTAANILIVRNSWPKIQFLTDYSCCHVSGPRIQRSV